MFLVILTLLLFICVKSNVVFSSPNSLNESSNLNLTKANTTNITNSSVTNKTGENISRKIVVNLTLTSFSCKVCKNGEKLTYKLCLNIENSSKTRTYFVNYSIMDINDNFVKKPHIAKIKVRKHRCVKRSWTVKTNHEVVFVAANVVNQSVHVKMPIYIIHSEKNYGNKVVSNITAKIPKNWKSGEYNYIELRICRGNVKSNTVYVKILKRKGKRFEHISKDAKIKLNKKDECYDMVLPIYINGICKNEEAEVVIQSKMFGKKEKRIVIIGNKKFCYKRLCSCHCYCHKKEEKRKVKKHVKKLKNKSSIKAKIFCKNFVNSSKFSAKLYLINNDKPKNCTIRYYVFNKHEPLDLKGWKNEKKVYVRPFEIKIVNLSLNLKNYTGKGKFKVKIICDNKTQMEILKELMIDSSRLNINKSKENETQVKTGLKEKQKKEKLKIKIRIKNYFENKTEKRPVINAEMIKKRSFTYKLFHLLIKWFNLHHKPIV